MQKGAEAPERVNQKSRITVAYHWDNGEPPPSFRWNGARILQLCQKLNAKRVLDLGCGNGTLARNLSAAGFQVTACDVDGNGVEIGRKGAPNIRFEVLGAYDDPSELEERNFDVVVSTEVIEHMFLPRQLSLFAKAVLKKGGHFILSTPYHGYLKNLAISLFNKWDFHHNALEDGGHIKFFSPKALTQLLDEVGFDVLERHFVGRFLYLWKGMIFLAKPRD
jgi:2-polyprenyl-3-methyl-5-hydroxy-6-metoxy-1,4-benzoquinol methylase